LCDVAPGIGALRCLTGWVTRTRSSVAAAVCERHLAAGCALASAALLLVGWVLVTERSVPAVCAATSCFAGRPTRSDRPGRCAQPV